MFEVPSACEDADELFAVIDFGRVGSNDLLQYLFACDRDSDEYDMQLLGNDPAIWRLLRRLVESARRAGKPLEVCGALADRTEFIPRLIDLGINAVSTHCDNVAAARKAALQRLRSR
jgi:phosphoenolpyruvate-protein kinase (PTS system EI component)